MEFTKNTNSELNNNTECDKNTVTWQDCQIERCPDSDTEKINRFPDSETGKKPLVRHVENDSLLIQLSRISGTFTLYSGQADTSQQDEADVTNQNATSENKLLKDKDAPSSINIQREADIGQQDVADKMNEISILSLNSDNNLLKDNCAASTINLNSELEPDIGQLDVADITNESANTCLTSDNNSLKDAGVPASSIHLKLKADIIQQNVSDKTNEVASTSLTSKNNSFKLDTAPASSINLKTDASSSVELSSAHSDQSDKFPHLENGLLQQTGQVTTRVSSDNTSIVSENMASMILNDCVYSLPTVVQKDVGPVTMDTKSHGQTSGEKQDKSQADSGLLCNENIDNKICAICDEPVNNIDQTNSVNNNMAVIRTTGCPHCICLQCAQDLILRDPEDDQATFNCPFCTVMNM